MRRELGALAVVAAVIVLLVAAGPAAAETYSEGVAGTPFSFARLGPGLSVTGGSDQTLVLDTERTGGEDTVNAVSATIDVLPLDGQSGVDVGFTRFRANLSSLRGVSIALFFTVDVTADDPVWQVTSPAGYDDEGTYVFDMPEHAGGKALAYRFQFSLPSTGASGEILIEDVSLDYGEYIPAPEDADDDADDEEQAGGKRSMSGRGSGTFDMGGDSGSGGGSGSGSGTGSGGGSGSGSGSGIGSGSGSGSGGGPAASTPAAADATGAITEAPLEPAGTSVGGVAVSGYRVDLSEVPSSGSGEAGGGAGGAGGGSVASSGSHNVPLLVAAAVAALALLAPLPISVFVARRTRSRLRTLADAVEELGATATP